MQVRVPNAMTVNTVGRPGAPSVPFPVAQRVERHAHGVEASYLYPLALHEVMDLVVPRMLPYAMLTGVDTYEHTETGAVPLAEICDRYGVVVTAEDSDTVAIATSDLHTLFGELQTYNMSALDLASGHEDLPTWWCAVWDGGWPVLPRAPRSTVFVSSHDDSGLWIEARDAALHLQLGQRLLTMLAGTHLLDGPGTVEVVEPSHELVAALLGTDAAFSCAQVGIRRRDTIIEVPFVRQYRKPFEVLPPTHTLVYDGSDGTWAIDELRAAAEPSA